MRRKILHIRKVRKFPMWKRWLIIFVCIGLIVARIIRPNIQVDVITIWLVAITAIMFLMPEIRSITPYIKRIKVGDTEIELKEQIKEEVKELGKEVDHVQDTVTNKAEREIPRELMPDINEVLQTLSISSRAALLLLSSKIEQQVNKRLVEAGLKSEDKYFSFRSAVLKGVQAGLFPEEISSSFLEFINVRHGSEQAQTNVTV
jgi:hypothetical protein